MLKQLHIQMMAFIYAHYICMSMRAMEKISLRWTLRLIRDPPSKRLNIMANNVITLTHQYFSKKGQNNFFTINFKI